MRSLKTILTAGALLALVATAAPARAQTGPAPSATHLALAAPAQIVAPELQTVTGPVELVVQLGGTPLAVAGQSGLAGRSYNQGLRARQEELLAKIRALGGVEKARLTRALNAVVIEIDAAQIPQLEGMQNVRSIRPVGSYELDLSETVAYIGAAAVQDVGVDGSGVEVAVLDSGIDYTHANLGGPGTLEAYEAAYGASTDDPRNTTLDGLFPTAKVVGGYDFVGEAWNGAASTPPLAPDPDPIDFEGHGTHVADIIGGSAGVAPGVSLWAVKVCSAVSTACSGVALLQGVEFALDPNGDGDLADKVDVINMSLGSSYGQEQDDLSEASANAVRAGVVVVASAGNSADRPYIVGSPSSTPEVISVAQTQVPSAVTYPLVVNTPAAIAGQYPNTATVDWAPIGAGFTGDLVYVGRACPAGSIAAGSPADPLLASPAGKVALIDRGACSVSLKVDVAAQAGAIGVLIANNAPGDAPTFSFGGGTTFVPTLVIAQATGNLLRANLAAGVNVSVSPDVVIPQIGGVVASSSRGPSFSYNTIKPDIAAPGASVSAVAGSGSGTQAFGGTSGAAPMVAGAAALLIDAFPGRSPAEYKALLMNTGETNIFTNPATQPGVLAPITRIGGGEVRVDRAYASETAAWDRDALTGSLSFGYVPIAGERSFSKRIRIQNYSDERRTYTITPGFRYADDAASEAVEVRVPGRVVVPAGEFRIVNLRLTLDAEKLPIWELDGGPGGGDGSALQGVEYDGYLTISDGGDTITMPWQILPHRSAEVELDSDSSIRLSKGVGEIELENDSDVLDGRIDSFALTGISPRIAKDLLPGAGDNFAVVDLKHVGVRLVDIGGGEFGVQFGISTYGRRAHPNYPAEFDIYIDADRDGVDDYVIYNSELGGFALTGQNVVNVFDLSTGGAAAYFFTDADLNSENIILTAPLFALGLTPSTQFDFSIYAYDNYFTGALTDAVEGMTHTLDQPKFLTEGPEAVPADGDADLAVTAVAGGATASPSQLGILLLLRDNKLEQESIAVRVR